MFSFKRIIHNYITLQQQCTKKGKLKTQLFNSYFQLYKYIHVTVGTYPYLSLRKQFVITIVYGFISIMIFCAQVIKLCRKKFNIRMVKINITLFSKYKFYIVLLILHKIISKVVSLRMAMGSLFDFCH